MPIARNSKQLGQALRRQRRQLKRSQTTLSEETALRQATVSRAEAGGSGTTLKTIFTLLAALDLELIVQSRSKDTSESEDIY